MRKAFVAFVVSISLACSSYADLNIQIQVFADGPGSGNGGVYNVKVLQGFLPGVGGTNSMFQSFCVEVNENLSHKGKYWVEISTEAIYGGSGGPDPDPLDAVTAGLYTDYLALNNNNDATANNYQLAIWEKEQEAYYDNVNGKWRETGGGVNSLHAAYRGIPENTITTLQAGATAFNFGPNDIGNIRILNLWDNAQKTGTPRQDLLVPIPAPGAGLLGLCGLACIGWIRRRSA